MCLQKIDLHKLCKMFKKRSSIYCLLKTAIKVLHVAYKGKIDLVIDVSSSTVKIH